uniref:Uncharacterized protein n=1 Tax=Arundo donax TaxID=35708 RepID=A0A0A9DMS2_ARUDO
MTNPIRSWSLGENVHEVWLHSMAVIESTEYFSLGSSYQQQHMSASKVSPITRNAPNYNK